ncbi:MAG: hypothetical protein C0433_12370 [Cyclobacterium sp.]|nr:hypothetical protein [Cyclobacterium sp.]
MKKILLFSFLITLALPSQAQEGKATKEQTVEYIIDYFKSLWMITDRCEIRYSKVISVFEYEFSSFFTFFNNSKSALTIRMVGARNKVKIYDDARESPFEREEEINYEYINYLNKIKKIELVGSP